jgi:hypothetical protein
VRTTSYGRLMLLIAAAGVTRTATGGVCVAISPRVLVSAAGYAYLGSIGVMMPTLSSSAAAASRHRSSR